MGFVEESETLQAALVRKFVFDAPTPRDEELLQAEIDRILAEQREDGRFGDTSGRTGEQINELHRFGFDMEAPEAQRAADALLALKKYGLLERLRARPAACAGLPCCTTRRGTNP